MQELERENIELKNELTMKKIKNDKKNILTKAEEKNIEKRKINITDHDERYMKKRNGCIRIIYNAQASFDEEHQFIIACDVTTECNDEK